MARQATGLTPAPTGVSEQTVFDGPLPTLPSFDASEILPPAAADRLRALRQHVADLHKVIPAFDDLQQMNLERIQAEQRLRRLTDHPHSDGFGLNLDDPRVVSAQRTLDTAIAQAKRIAELRTSRSQAWELAARPLQAVEGFLRSGKHGVVLHDYDGPQPTLNKGESITDAIERLRRRGRELQSDLHRVRSAPFPASSCKQRLREQIEALAQRAAPDVSLLIEHDGKLAFPTKLMRVTVHNAGPAVAFIELVDPVALAAWLDPSALTKALDALVDGESDDGAALTVEARAKAEAEVEGDLLDIERQEAALVWRAMDERLPCEHRTDINPVALLGLQLITAPRAVPSSGSSAEHVWDFVQPGAPR